MLREEYVHGAVALVTSLKISKTSCRNLICFVSDDIRASSRKLLSYFFSEVIVVPVLHRDCPPLRTNRAREIYDRWIDKSFTKWSCLKMLDEATYDRVIFIDADTCITRNVDHLFAMPPAFATLTSFNENPNIDFVDEIYAFFDSCWSRNVSCTDRPNSSNNVSAAITSPSTAVNGIVRPNVLATDRRETYRGYCNGIRSDRFSWKGAPYNRDDCRRFNSIRRQREHQEENTAEVSSTIVRNSRRRNWMTLNDCNEKVSNCCEAKSVTDTLLLFPIVDLRKLKNVFTRSRENESFYGNTLFSSAFMVFRRFHRRNDGQRYSNSTITATTKRTVRSLYSILVDLVKARDNAIFAGVSRFHNGWDEIVFVQALLRYNDLRQEDQRYDMKVFHLPVEYCWVAGFYELLRDPATRNTNHFGTSSLVPFVVTYYGDKKPWSFSDEESTWLDVFIWRWYYEKALYTLTSEQRLLLPARSASSCKEQHFFVEIRRIVKRENRDKVKTGNTDGTVVASSSSILFPALYRVSTTARRQIYSIECVSRVLDRNVVGNKVADSHRKEVEKPTTTLVASWINVPSYDLHGVSDVLEFRRTLRTSRLLRNETERYVTDTIEELDSPTVGDKEITFERDTKSQQITVYKNILSIGDDRTSALIVETVLRTLLLYRSHTITREQERWHNEILSSDHGTRW